ncbi:hypothetical protein [Nonomuraea sp. NPDC003754]
MLAAQQCPCHSRPAQPAAVVVPMTAAAVASMLLKDELGKLGIYADVNEHRGVALVSLWLDLIIWCDGTRFSFWTGQHDHRGARVYAVLPVDDVDATARRAAQRYAEHREAEPLVGLAEYLA